MVNLADLKSAAKDALKLATLEMETDGISYVITSGYRSQSEQIAYFAQGREPLESVNAKRKIAGLPPLPAQENTYTITKCDGVKDLSNHQSGLAIDIVPAVVENGKKYPIWPPATDKRWLVIANIMKKYGWKWGGDWKNFPDQPHYEIKG